LLFLLSFFSEIHQVNIFIFIFIFTSTNANDWLCQ
jgi:hypothetical protein